MTNDGRLITTRQAAQILGVDTRSIHRRATTTPTGRPGEIIARHKSPGIRGAYLFDETYIRDLADPTKRQSAVSARERAAS
jgi:hypothetical protein